jgi:hypothetical protein
MLLNQAAFGLGMVTASELQCPAKLKLTGKIVLSFEVAMPIS